ncbi:MBL fold metallo-hydrolase [Persicitalea jodogahamensis]|uniref:Coenzyme PQQ synthesis protein B n=1 Tax=Persicitalea jodogahamensis TaxID=402147 RepID=A0A8J3D0P4_9BACT|nr:MBL fold metallo-hydrolase [Persicitalea jodogahamensis]GHB51589.1 coenzyme PQQ synthesis protein B [Persicitalea jodogahamensis]
MIHSLASANKYLISLLALIASAAFSQKPFIMVLGVAQDGGYPQAGCQKECCRAVWPDKNLHGSVSCIAIVDPESQESWLFDATPDFAGQTHRLAQADDGKASLTGIFLTHAHIGHYTGLMQLGREVMGAGKVHVYAMPRMKDFLGNNGPWSQLVSLQNIEIRTLSDKKEIELNERIRVMPFRVPHRDEFSETVGYKIMIGSKSLIFIPDIDKWQKWEQNLVEVVEANDFLLIDGTFYQDGEIARPMSEVPHPYISETMELLSTLPLAEKKKVHFIHFNHTNPVLRPGSAENLEVRERGFRIAEEGQKIDF